MKGKKGVSLAHAGACSLPVSLPPPPPSPFLLSTVKNASEVINLNAVTKQITLLCVHYKLVWIITPLFVKHNRTAAVVFCILGIE